jgi:fatty-acyl-CoA synthase
VTRSPGAGGYAGFVARWRRSGRVALTTPTRQLTYAEWADRGDELARALMARGLQPPARVATLLPNGPELLIALYACARAGTTLVPLSTWATQDEVLRVLDAADPELVLTSDEFPGTTTVIAAARSRSSSRWSDSAWAWSAADGYGETAGLDPIDGLLADAAAIGARDRSKLSRDFPGADLVVLYTSGSTGQPKGVLLRQSAVRRNASAIVARMGYGDGERVFSYFPLFFSGGLCNALSGVVAVGGELVTQARFEPTAAAGLIRDMRCTARIVWHDGLRPIIEAGGLAAGDVRRMNRGLLVDQDLLEELGATDDRGVNMYGMTETATAFTCGDASEPAQVRHTSHGRPLPGNELRVIEPDSGRPLPPRAEGELCVRGPSLMSGYTDGSHHGLMTDDGFFRTGDVGYVEDDGHVHYLGRIKTMIKVRGLTVQPEEVETVLMSLDGVRRAVVVGLGDGDESSGVGALLVAAATRSLDAAAVEAHCRTRLSAYKVPMVKFVSEAEFPVSASLKSDRLRARRLLSAS